MISKKQQHWEKDGSTLVNFWIPTELSNRFETIRKKCGIGKSDLAARLIKDFCDGNIYDLPSWKPIDRKKLIHYKDDNGKWIYVTSEEFIDRVDKKQNGRANHDPEGEGNDSEKKSDSGILEQNKQKMGPGEPDP